MHGKSLFILSICLVWSNLYAGTWKGDVLTIFKGSSTLHDFSGNVQSPVTATLSPEGAWTFHSVVPVKDMSTNNKTRDKNMWTMFNAGQHQAINATVASHVPASSANTAIMPLQVTISGKTLPIEATVKQWKHESGELRFQLDFTLSLAAFDLEAPSSMLGLVKVKDSVSVHCDLGLRETSHD